jgi:phage repressor protein C with HTH and peptisase S24 domain
MSIGDRIKQLRGRDSRKALGLKIGLDQATIMRYESNQRLPDTEFVAKLCQLYNVSTDWLIYGHTSLELDVTGHKAGLPEAKEGDELYPVSGLPKNHSALSGIKKFAEKMRPIAEKFQAFGLEIKSRYQECAHITDPDEYAYVPLVRAQASAGGGFALEEFDDEDIDYVAFRRNWLVARGNPKNFKLMEVKGDSMEPIVCDSDMVLLDFSRIALRPGKIFAVAFDGHIYLKRLFAEPGRLILRSENKVHADVIVDLDDSHQADKVTIIGQAIGWFHNEKL